MARPKKNLVPQTFIDATNNMSTEELRNEILKSSEKIDEIIEERESNVKFQQLKETYADAAGGYRDAINTEKAKAEFAKIVLKQRGQTVPAPNVPAAVAAQFAKVK